VSPPYRATAVASVHATCSDRLRAVRGRSPTRGRVHPPARPYLRLSQNARWRCSTTPSIAPAN